MMTYRVELLKFSIRAVGNINEGNYRVTLTGSLLMSIINTYKNIYVGLYCFI